MSLLVNCYGVGEVKHFEWGGTSGGSGGGTVPPSASSPPPFCSLFSSGSTPRRASSLTCEKGFSLTPEQFIDIYKK